MSEILNNPWADIASPAMGSITSRRVDARYRYDFYFSKDFVNHYMLVFSLKDNADIDDKIELNGVDVSRTLVNGCSAIVLTLKDNTDWKIFATICHDLCQIASEQSSEMDAVRSFYNRLRYWQYFLKKNSEDILSIEEQVGLIGELLFIYRYLLGRYSELETINFWTGIDGDVQDFFIKSSRIEVKTCSSSSKREVNVSSLEQLYTVSGMDIFLTVVTICKTTSDATDGFSLYSLANKIASTLKDRSIEAYDLFLRKLSSSGMFLDGKYNERFYTVLDFDCYRVADGFPRITPKDIPAGVVKAKYTIDLDKCEQYRIVIEDIFTQEK